MDNLRQLYDFTELMVLAETRAHCPQKLRSAFWLMMCGQKKTINANFGLVCPLSKEYLCFVVSCASMFEVKLYLMDILLVAVPAEACITD